MTVRVMIADDQAVVRDGLALLLSASGDIDVVSVASDGAEAVEFAVRDQPDVALVDLRMPRLDGAGVTAALAEQAASVRVLILTTYADDDAVLPALKAGAAGYLTKDTTGEALVAAIRDVAAGRTVLDAAVQARLVAMLREPANPPVTPAGPGGSPGPSASDAGPEGLTHVLAKLDVEGRPGLVAWAWRHGLAGR